MDPKEQSPEASQNQKPANPQNPPIVNDISTPPAQTNAPQPNQQQPDSQPVADQSPVPSNPAIKSPPPEQEQSDVPAQAAAATDQSSQANDSATDNPPKPAPTLGAASPVEDTPEKIDDSEAISNKTDEKPDKKASKAPKKAKSNKPVAFIIFAIVIALILMSLIVMSYMEQADEDADPVPANQTQQISEVDNSAAEQQIDELQSEVDALTEELAESEQELNTLDQGFNDITEDPDTPVSNTVDNQETTN